MKKDKTLKEVEDSLAVSQRGAMSAIRLTGFIILLMFGTAWLLTSGLLPSVDADVTSLFGKMFILGVVAIIICAIVAICRVTKARHIEKTKDMYITHDIRLTERNSYSTY